MVTPESIQKIVKAVIVKNLGKSFDPESNQNGLSLQIEGADYLLKIPEKPALQEILTTLGVSEQMHARIEPIQATMNFGPDSLKIKVEKTGTNLFRILAHWQVDELTAVSKSLNMLVPKGVFDQEFTIASSPVSISIKPKTGAVTADLALTASLSDQGTKINLESFKTNLDSPRTRLHLKLGELTVNGKPLELQIISNGENILTDEPTVRAQFQSFEPELMQNIQVELSTVIHKVFSGLAAKLQEEAPFRISIDSTNIVNKYSLSESPYAPLLKGISANFEFSYIQSLPSQNLFTTQFSSQVCIDTKCLDNVWGDSTIGTTDTKLMKGSDAGLILNESWVQNVVNSDAFQSRIEEYYTSSLASPGVTLGSDGIKVHFNPSKNAIVAVLNLVIDIKATASPKGAWSSWSKFTNYYKDQLAGTWENIAGSGKYVFLPIEIDFNLMGIQNNADDKAELLVTSEIPVHADGTVDNTYGYKSNLSKMNKSIRKALVNDVKTIINKSLPATIKIAVDQPLEVEGVKFTVKKVLVTKNKGLLVSGDIQ